MIQSSQVFPTIGMNVEPIIIEQNTNMLPMDYGGRVPMRLIQHSYYENIKALIFVIDSCDREGTAQAYWKLHRLIDKRHLNQKPILILANKQDLPNAMTLDEIREKLCLNQLDKNIKWHLQPTSASQNTGIKEGLQWLATTSMAKNIMMPFIEIYNDLKPVWN